MIFLLNILGLFLWNIKGYTITNASQKILKESKLNKILVDQENEFCNNSVKNWLKDNDIEMYKWMIDWLDDLVNKYSNTYHRKIKMKPVDVKDNTYIDSMELSRSNDKDPKSKIGDHVRISRIQTKLVWRNFCNLKS